MICKKRSGDRFSSAFKQHVDTIKDKLTKLDKALKKDKEDKAIKKDKEDKLVHIQCICDQRHNRSGRQQKECRAKHDCSVKCSKFAINPRIEPHHQKPDYEILQHRI